MSKLMTHDERRERRRLMAEALRQGKTMAEVCQEFKVSMKTVRVAAEENGIGTEDITPENNLNHRQRHRRRQLMAQRIKEGRSVLEVAAEFGVAVTTVRSAAKVGGVKIPRENTVSINTMEIVAELLNTDKTMHQIARERQVSPQWVHNVYNKAKSAGIRVPERKPPEWWQKEQ